MDVQEQFHDKHFELHQRHLSELTDETLIILKTHLLIEELLRDFCVAMVEQPKHLLEARLTFKQIMMLARSLVSHNTDWIWGVLGNLNRMRNLMAHAIEPSQKEYSRCAESIIQLVAPPLAGADVPTLKQALQYSYGWLSGSFLTIIEFRQERKNSPDE